MARVPTTVSQTTYPVGFRAGGALSALGNMFTNISSTLKEAEEKKNLDELSKAYEEFLNNDKKRLETSNMLSQPATLSALEGIKLKPPMSGQSVESPEKGREAFELYGEPELPGGSVTQSALAPTQQPQLPTQPELPTQPGLPTQPAPYGTEQFMGNVNSAMMQRGWEVGMQRLMETTPKAALDEAMAQYQHMAQLAAKAKRPDIAIQFVKDKLGFLTKEHNSETSILFKVLDLQRRQDEFERKLQHEKDMVPIKTAGAIEVKGAKSGGGSIPKPTKSEEAKDKDYAKRYNEFTEGGAVNAKVAMDNLEALAAEMEKKPTKGGGRFAKEAPDWMRSREAIKNRDNARNFANTTLKKLFGGQLSDAEREAAAKEYYNDALDNKQNAALIRTKVKQLREVYENEINKARYFEANDTLKGWKAPAVGAVPTKKQITEEDIDRMSEEELRASGLL